MQRLTIISDFGRSPIREKASLTARCLLLLTLGGCFDGWKIDNPHARPVVDLVDLAEPINRIPCTSNSECTESGLCIDVQYLPENEVPERKDTCVSKDRIIYVSSSSTTSEPDGTQAKPFHDLQSAVNASIQANGRRPYVFAKGDFKASMLTVGSTKMAQLVLLGSAADPTFKRKITPSADWTKIGPRSRLAGDSGYGTLSVAASKLIVDGFDFSWINAECQFDGYVTFRRSVFEGSAFINARNGCKDLRVYRSVFARSGRAAIHSRTDLQVGNSLFFGCPYGQVNDEYSGTINIGAQACISGVTLVNNIRDKRGAMRVGEGSIFCMGGAKGQIRRTIIHENDLTKMEPLDMSGPKDLSVVRDFSVPRDLSAGDMMPISDLTSPDMSDVSLQQNCNGYPVDYILSPMTLAKYANGPEFLNSMGVSASDYMLKPDSLINKTYYIDKKDANGECLDPEERGLDFFGAERVQGEAQDIGFHETSPPGSPLSPKVVTRKLAREITVPNSRKNR